MTDITDKFDYTFLFGDLNFRLDVSRLHADWMIARQGELASACTPQASTDFPIEYDQALSFDQLRRLMKDGQAFIGFNEAPIKFPPTFKYDVMKGVRRDKTPHGSVHRGIRRWISPASYQNFTEVQEIDRYGEGSADMDDAASFDSTVMTAVSSRSRGTSVGDPEEAEAAKGLAQGRKLSRSKYDRPTGFDSPIQNIFAASSVLKAKKKWLGLLKPSSSTTLPAQNHQRLADEDRGRPVFSSSTPQIMQIDVETPTPSFQDTSFVRDWGRVPTPSPMELKRSSSRRSTKSNKSANMLSLKGNDASSTQMEVESGVYDTSSKKRVPSWYVYLVVSGMIGAHLYRRCDRILWKTTIEMEEDSDDEGDILTRTRSGLGPRMRAFISQALRPLSERMRASSLVNISSTAPLTAPAAQSEFPHLALSRQDDTMPSVSMPPLSSTKGQENGLFRVRSHVPRQNRQSTAFVKSKSIGASVEVPSLKHQGRRRSNTELPTISSPIPPASPASSIFTDQAPDVLQTRSLANQPHNGLHISLPDPGAMKFSKTADAIPGPRTRTTSIRGWRFFPSFFGRDITEGDAFKDSPLDTHTPDRERELLQEREKEKRPRRGEVRVMSYRSLDDQEMWRLEGRSDHRPVIGSYVVYI